MKAKQPQNKKFKHLSQNSDSISVRSSNGLCVAIVDAYTDAAWASQALEKEMQKSDAFGGIMIFSMKEDFNQVSSQLQANLAEMGISITHIADPQVSLEHEANKIIEDFEKRQNKIVKWFHKNN